MERCCNHRIVSRNSLRLSSTVAAAPQIPVGVFMRPRDRVGGMSPLNLWIAGVVLGFLIIGVMTAILRRRGRW